MSTGTFTAYLNSDHVYIDLTDLPSTIKQKFHINCQNQSLYVLYFKIICGISDWSLDTPSNGHLGAVSAGLIEEFEVDLTRTNPLAEVTDSGNLTLEVYSDAGYTALVDSMDLACTVEIEDLETWTNVTIYDFAGGSADGFAGGIVTNEVAVGTGGYSYISPEGNGDKSLLRTNTSFPNNTKVRVCVYFVLRGRFINNVINLNASLVNLRTQINSIDQDFLAQNLVVISVTTVNGIIYSSPWIKLVIDASSFKNTSQLLSFIGTLGGGVSGTYNCYPSFLIGKVVIVGKD